MLFIMTDCCVEDVVRYIFEFSRELCDAVSVVFDFEDDRSLIGDGARRGAGKEADINIRANRRSRDRTTLPNSHSDISYLPNLKGSDSKARLRSSDSEPTQLRQTRAVQQRVFIFAEAGSVHFRSHDKLASAEFRGSEAVQSSARNSMSDRKLMDQIFNLKFTSKQLVRGSKRAEKDEKLEKLKVKKAIEKNNLDGAKIYAQVRAP